MIIRVGAVLLAMALAAAPARAIELNIKNCNGGLVSVWLYNEYDDMLAFFFSAGEIVYRATKRFSCGTSACKLRVGYPPDHVSQSGRVINYLNPTYKADLCVLNADQQVLHEFATCSC